MKSNRYALCCTPKGSFALIDNLLQSFIWTDNMFIRERFFSQHILQYFDKPLKRNEIEHLHPELFI